MSDSETKRSNGVRLLLIALPVWLVASGAAAVWYFLHQEKQQAIEEQQRFARAISVPMLEDDLKKIVQVIGERHAGSEKTAANLTRTASMIEGLLGPSNTGYSVRRDRGPDDWPLLGVSVTGKEPGLPALWIVSSYDSRPGSPGVEGNATGLAATLAAAQALANEPVDRSVHFVFLPHANDPESPVIETAAALNQRIAGEKSPPAAVIYVESMGAGESLWLSSRDTAALPLSQTRGIGSVRGAEVVCLGDDLDISSILFENGLPAVRVSTRPILAADDPDDRLPVATTLAASAGRLVELIRRCASAR